MRRFGSALGLLPAAILTVAPANAARSGVPIPHAWQSVTLKHGSTGSFALGAKRIAYVSDFPNDPGFKRAVFSRTLHNGSGGLAFSRAQQLSPSNTNPDRFASVALAGGTTAYVTAIRGHDFKESLHLVTAKGVRTVTIDANGLSTVGASKRWVTVDGATGFGVTLVDLRSGKISHILQGHRRRNFAQSGNFYFYAHGRNILRMDLRTGKSTLIYTTQLKPQANTTYSVSVYGNGPWTGWNISNGTATDSGMSNVNRPHQVITFAHRIYAMSPFGALLRSSYAGHYEKIHTWIQPFDGPLRQLLPSQRYRELPRVSRHFIAWVARSGHLKAAPFR